MTSTKKTLYIIKSGNVHAKNKYPENTHAAWEL